MPVSPNEYDKNGKIILKYFYYSLEIYCIVWDK